MKIALDLDDTITACPEFFVEMAAGLRSRGHEIYILTFRRERQEIYSTLKELGLESDGVVNLPSDFNVAEKDPSVWKAERCAEYGIDVLIDDMTDVLNAVPSSVFSLLARDHERGELVYESLGPYD
jgi:hypothetical protein